MKNGELCASGIVPAFTDTAGVVGISGLLGAAGAAPLAGAAAGADWTGGAGAVGPARPPQATRNRGGTPSQIRAARQPSNGAGPTSQIGEPSRTLTASSVELPRSHRAPSRATDGSRGPRLATNPRSDRHGDGPLPVTVRGRHANLRRARLTAPE